MTVTHTVTLINNTHTLGTPKALAIEGDIDDYKTIPIHTSKQRDLATIQHDILFVDTLCSLIDSSELIVKLNGITFTSNQVGQWKYVDASGVVPSASGLYYTLMGTQDFTIDLEQVTGTTYGFKIIDTSAEYFRLIRKADAAIDLETALRNIDLATSGTLDLDSVGNLTMDSDAATSIGGASVAVEADGGTLAITGDGTNDIDISNAGATIDVDSDIVDIETTDSIDLDAVGNLTMDSDAATSIGGASVAVEADGGTLAVTGDGTNDIDISNVGATIDVDAAAVDVATTTSLTLDSDGSTALGGSSVEIESDGSDVSLVAAGGIYLQGSTGTEIQLSTALADQTAHGFTISGTVGPAATFGYSLYLANTGTYQGCDADAAATMPCRALAIDTGAGAGKLLLMQGVMRDDSWAWTVGGTLYVSTTTGGLTQTAPSGLGDQVQAVGHAITSTIIYFNPNLYFIEIT